jgi:hypothetical protein
MRSARRRREFDRCGPLSEIKVHLPLSREHFRCLHVRCYAPDGRNPRELAQPPDYRFRLSAYPAIRAAHRLLPLSISIRRRRFRSSQDSPASTTTWVSRSILELLLQQLGRAGRLRMGGLPGRLQRRYLQLADRRGCRLLVHAVCRQQCRPPADGYQAGGGPGRRVDHQRR